MRSEGGGAQLIKRRKELSSWSLNHFFEKIIVE